jgi:Fe-S cluster assembly protein SufD
MSNVTPIRTPAEAAILSAFEQARTALPGLKSEREAAFAAFSEAGLPHRRVEAWKYTDLRAALREAAPLASRPNDAETIVALKGKNPFAGVGGLSLAFVNGHHVATEGTVPAGVTVTPLAKALAEGHPALAHLGALHLAKGDVALSLNAAFMSDGVIVEVAEGITFDQPIMLRFVTSGASAVAPVARVLLVAAADSRMTLVESHEGQGPLAHQPNTATEIVAGDRAHVTHVRLGAHGEGTIALSTVTVSMGDETSVTSLNVALSGALSRHQVFGRMAGKDARLRVNGATLLHGRQHADSTLVVEHVQEPGGESRELFRTIVDDEATGVFQGKIIVKPEAQKTDGRMASNCILLGDAAQMFNKPELEIFADDVACAHGATCGQLDDELLFYLMSRGIARAEAEALMVESFVGEAIDFIDDESITDVLHGLVQDWLRARAARMIAGAGV